MLLLLQETLQRQGDAMQDFIQPDPSEPEADKKKKKASVFMLHTDRRYNT